MAFQAAPTITANNANQNAAQPMASQSALPPVFNGNFQAAPKTLAVFQPKPTAVAIG